MAKAKRRVRKTAEQVEGATFAKHTLPFLFTLVGAIVILITGVATIAYIFTSGNEVAAFFVSKYNINIPFPMVYRAILASGSIGILSGAVLIGVAVTMNTRKRGKIVASGIIGLAFSLLSLLNGGGFYLGFILAFLGSLLAILYNKI